MPRPHLTFKAGERSIPLAYIRDGTFKGEILYIDQDKVVDDEPNVRFVQDLPIDPKLLKKYTPRERTKIIHRISRALATDKPVEEDIADILHYIKNKNKEQSFIHLEGSDFFMCPSPKDKFPDRIFVFAKAGSGKSTWTANYIKQWRKLYPKKPIFMFCRSTEDPAFDGIELIRVPMTNELIDMKIKVEQTKEDETELEEGCLCIFDDICAGLEKDIEKEVYRILADVLTMGRKRNIFVMHLEHRGADANKTKYSLSEANAIVVFPWGCPEKALKYVLGTYGGLGNREITKLRKLNSRWALIRQDYPPAVLYEHGAYLLSGKTEDEEEEEKSKK